MSTHFLTSQPALIKLNNENIGGHLTPLHTPATLQTYRRMDRQTDRQTGRRHARKWITNEQMVT